MEIVITLALLLFSVIIHEVCHGLMAEYLGDPTARMQGRITLNPISHIDPFGSILVPLLLYMSGARVLGAAKPVPVDFFRLTRFRNIRLGAALVSFAGPLSNFGLMLGFALLYRIFGSNEVIKAIAFQGLYINLVLGTFNLIPIPPLDGGKILFSLLPYESMFLWILSIERYGFILIYALLSSGVLSSILNPVINGVLKVLVY